MLSIQGLCAVQDWNHPCLQSHQVLSPSYPPYLKKESWGLAQYQVTRHMRDIPGKGSVLPLPRKQSVPLASVMSVSSLWEAISDPGPLLWHSPVKHIRRVSIFPFRYYIMVLHISCVTSSLSNREVISHFSIWILSSLIIPRTAAGS